MWKSYKIKEQIYITEFYSLFEQKYKKGYTFTGESHNFWECLYVISGQVCVSGDERVYNLSSGQIIFHKPLELHKFHVDEDCHLFVFSFSAEGEIMDFFKNKVFTLNPEQHGIIDVFRKYLASKLKRYNPDFLYYSMYLSVFDLLKTFSQSVASYISILLLSLCDDNEISYESNSDEAAIFTKAVNYMNNSICGQPSIVEIAKACNTSASTIKRIFSKYAGMGVHKYFLKLKTKTAAELLKDGITVTETADKLGFSGQGYFSAVFKRETGLSPTEYKKNNTHTSN